VDVSDFLIEPERYELSEPRRYTFELERREFMRILSVMGGGLLVVVGPPRADAQEAGRGGQGRADSPELGAWLHIDRDGKITGYTGKTEVGQNIRTSLAQAIADELRVPISTVSLVMADTELTPYDAGTFGSLSTPRMARQLSRAAATAREMLMTQAATRLKADRARVVVRDGRISAPGGASLTYGELVDGQKMTGTIPAEPPVTPAARWEVRGKPAKKVNGRDIVTGRHAYTSDIVRPNMGIGRVVRGSIGATLVSVKDDAARAIPEVAVVRDGEFVGVVAATERIARKAAAALQTEWRALEGQPNSETLYEHLKKAPEGKAGGRNAPAPTIVGDVTKALAGASRTFEASYRIPYIAHVPLEPRAAVAEWTDGKLTVWVGTQRPFGVRVELAEAFRIPEANVRVIVPDTGSAYGGKHTGEHAIEAARLAKGAGRPVKLVWTRQEEFTFGYLRPAGVIDVRAAVDGSGSLVAWEFDNWNSGASAIRTPYDVPNQRIAFHPSVSPLRQGSYRGLAATANHYVREMHMDHVARELGVDAVQFRLKHLKEERIRAVLAAAAERIGWPKPSAEGRAVGIACGTEKGGYVATAAELSKTPTGFTIERLVVAFECGAIVNPDGLDNQVSGCVVQGLGGALFEAIDFANGRIRNASMDQYRVPRFKDIPPIEVVLLDRKDLPSAGAGEAPIVCVAPAIGSAARAFGLVATALPVTLVPASNKSSGG
jgi:nicotinate dehydrogenase subunit B